MTIKLPLPLRLVLPALIALVSFSGCGENPAELRATVTGKVTLDGEPLKEGRIKFVPESGPVSGGDIKDGVYNIPVEKGVAFGKNQIEINSTRKTGKKVKSSISEDMIDATEEAIPEKYNKRTTLEKDVAKGPNTLDFALESKPAAK